MWPCICHCSDFKTESLALLNAQTRVARGRWTVGGAGAVHWRVGQTDESCVCCPCCADVLSWGYTIPPTLNEKLNQNCVTAKLSGVHFVCGGLWVIKVHPREAKYLCDACNWMRSKWPSLQINLFLSLSFPSQWWQEWGCAAVHHSCFSTDLMPTLCSVHSQTSSPSLVLLCVLQTNLKVKQRVRTYSHHPFPLVNMNGFCYA